MFVTAVVSACGGGTVYDKFVSMPSDGLERTTQLFSTCLRLPRQGVTSER